MEQQEKQLAMLKQVNDRVENKLKKLMVYATFLEECREENQDEFKEVQDLLSRYETLRSENKRLHKEHSSKEAEINILHKNIEEAKESQKNTIVGLLQRQQDQKNALEVKENHRQRLIKSQKEDYERNLAQTREHGTIILTIENLNKTLSERLEQFIGKKEELKSRKDNESIEEKARRSLSQLEVIEEFAILCKLFKDQY